jgi:hypothetical protein
MSKVSIHENVPEGCRGAGSTKMGKKGAIFNTTPNIAKTARKDGPGDPHTKFGHMFPQNSFRVLFLIFCFNFFYGAQFKLKKHLFFVSFKLAPKRSALKQRFLAC